MSNNLEHLSNEELVNEYNSAFNPSSSKELCLRRRALGMEILRRLNEPWRKQKG